MLRATREVERSTSPVAISASPTREKSASCAPVNGSVPFVLVAESGAVALFTGAEAVCCAPLTPAVFGGDTEVACAPATPAVGAGVVGVSGTGDPVVVTGGVGAIVVVVGVEPVVVGVVTVVTTVVVVGGGGGITMTTGLQYPWTVGS